MNDRQQRGGKTSEYSSPRYITPMLYYISNSQARVFITCKFLLAQLSSSSSSSSSAGATPPSASTAFCLDPSKATSFSSSGRQCRSLGLVGGREEEESDDGLVGGEGKRPQLCSCCHGFIAPEYNEEGRLSFKSDVYSFGATLLQVIGGKKLPPPPVALSVERLDYGPLNKWAWDLCREGRTMEFIDPSLNGEPQTEINRWVQIALLCIQKSPEQRPSMSELVVMLSSKCECDQLQTPSQPAYY